MLKKILIVIAFLLLVGLFLLTKDWDSPELGQALLDEVGEATGVRNSETHWCPPSPTRLFLWFFLCLW